MKTKEKEEIIIMPSSIGEDIHNIQKALSRLQTKHDCTENNDMVYLDPTHAGISLEVEEAYTGAMREKVWGWRKFWETFFFQAGDCGGGFNLKLAEQFRDILIRITRDGDPNELTQEDWLEFIEKSLDLLDELKPGYPSKKNE